VGSSPFDPFRLDGTRVFLEARKMVIAAISRAALIPERARSVAGRIKRNFRCEFD